MGRIVGLILFVGCILVGCQGASEQPLESDNLAAQSGQIIHHVFFWLNNPDSESDKQQLIEEAIASACPLSSAPFPG